MTTFITSNNAPPTPGGGQAVPSQNIAPTRAGLPAYFQLVLVAVVLPGGSIGAAYSETISAQGGTAPYVFTLSGSLPPGLALSSSGVISGTPTTAGTYSFAVEVTDANLFQGFQNFSITISPGGGGNWGWIG